MFQITESLSKLKTVPFGSATSHTNSKHAHKSIIKPICSLGHQNSRGSPSTSNPSSSNKSFDSNQRHRVSAVAINAPYENKEDTELLSELHDQTELLQHLSYLTSIQSMEENDDLQHNTTTTTTKPPLLSAYANNPSNDIITVRSTKRRLSDEKHNPQSNTNKQPTTTTSRTSGIPIEPKESIDGDELAADAEFVTALRSWLKVNRRAQRPSRNTRGPSANNISPNMVSIFLTTLGNTPVLSSKQERYLARVIARGNKVRNTAASLARSTGARPSLSAVAEAAGLPSPQDAAKAVLLAEDARALMIEFNIRFVVSIAKRYAGNGLDLSDLIPEGMLGLRKAIDKFDHAKGFKFSTYAHWWIRQSVSRAISDQGRDVRLPVHIVEFLSKLQKVTNTLKSDPDRTSPPSYSELAAAMGVPLRRLMTVMRSSRTPKSPDDLSKNFGVGMKDGAEPIGNYLENISEYEDAFEYSNNPDPLAEYERLEYLQETFALLLSTLPVRERNIIRLRYGLNPLAQSDAIDTLVAAMANNNTKNGSGSNGNGSGKKGKSSSKSSNSSLDVDDMTDTSHLNSFFSDDDDDPMTGLGLAQVGIIHRLSRERIRQIEADAIRHLRMPWRINLLSRVKAGDPMNQDIVDRLLQASDVQNTSWY